jgi:predicted AAA+ superfamily ATPase
MGNFMHPRHIQSNIEAALLDTPVVLINGARQTGKSTLVEHIAQKRHFKTIVSLDNYSALESASKDPENFIQHFEGSIVIDEIQKEPLLFPAIKSRVDKNRKAGQFILTGSANVLLLPKISESLAGRMEIITLWPLSQGEIRSHQESFIDIIFSEQFHFSHGKTISRHELFELLLCGGYPEILTRTKTERKEAWFESYITAILQRDIRDIANIEGLTQLPRLLSILTARAATLLNTAELSRTTSIPHTSLTRYLTLLQTTFLIYPLLPFSSNLGKRLVKSPKLFLNDTGLMCYLLGINKSNIKENLHQIGKIFENFVVTELKKQLTWNRTRANIFHYRTQSGQEVDVLLENAQGKCVGIEIKLSDSISDNDFKGLKILSEDLHHQFLRGIVLYTGEKFLPFGKNFFAVPVSYLWND